MGLFLFLVAFYLKNEKAKIEAVEFYGPKEIFNEGSVLFKLAALILNKDACKLTLPENIERKSLLITL